MKTELITATRMSCVVLRYDSHQRKPPCWSGLMYRHMFSSEQVHYDKDLSWPSEKISVYGDQNEHRQVTAIMVVLKHENFLETYE